MARVVLTGELARRFPGKDTEIKVAARNVRHLYQLLDELYPGMGEVFEARTLAVAIDGDIVADAFLEPLEDDTEVAFLPAI
ncbi:MAG: MoaD/ThiS family protein, partial [Gammaproteobacteria bacterium]